MNIYIYPNRYFKFGIKENSYIEDLGEALENKGCTIIKGRTGWLGPLDFFLYLKKVDIFFVNWLEEVEFTKYGLIKVPFVLLFLFVIKFTKIKLVWTIHNKRPHDRKREYAVSFLRKILFKESDLIIAHSKSELYVFGKNQELISYYPHPFKVNSNISSNFKLNKQNILYDIVIWGRIEPYKGILEFLEYLKEKALLSKYKIIIQGKCNNIKYWKQIDNYNSDRIKIENKFLSENDLLYLYKKSKVVLFTHKENFLLSSGALVHSLNNYKTILGPESGNFIDLSQLGIVQTYKDFDDLITKLDKIICNNFYINQMDIQNIIIKYTWNEYAQFLIEKFNNIENLD